MRPEHLSELAALLQRTIGLDVRPGGLGALRLALEARSQELGAAFRGAGAYLETLQSEAGEEELRQLLPLVTVGKTSFFRDERQFAAVAALLPDLLARRRAEGGAVSIWSAACATGEEIYSLGMSALEAGARPRDVELLGSDVNPRAVAAAEAGRFEARRMREVRADLRHRYFEREGEAYSARQELRQLVRVQTHNLASGGYPSSRAGGWDLVFCRNILIYFDTATVQRVLSWLRSSMAPGGLLFLGYSESLFRVFDGFELTEVAGAFLYRRPAGAARQARRTARAPLAPQPPARQARAAPLQGPPVRTSEEELAGAAELLQGGRFVAARELLEGLLSRHPQDLALRLTLANLYSLLREPERARESYQAALAIEPLHAETHLFYGVERLGAGDAEAAAQALSRALFLDPDLVIGHYFLGRCREAQRDVQRARLSYANAIKAYQRNPGARRKPFLGYYPDLSEDGGALARSAAYALAAL
ncbi:MAG: chemotaxis protein CheR [Anaeromyxobacter sp. RBG_16_69_14]|nr:MAG: chemotaxis protein CheR [Anaeromyxobacter sp. RBG_16_69_14]